MMATGGLALTMAQSAELKDNFKSQKISKEELIAFLNPKKDKLESVKKEKPIKISFPPTLYEKYFSCMTPKDAESKLIEILDAYYKK